MFGGRKLGEETRATATLDPLIGVDVARLEKEMEQYQNLLDENADYAYRICLLYTSPSPRDQRGSRMPSSA